MNTVNRSIFGRNIRAFRESMGLTQPQLADALGVSVPTENKWENKGIQPRRRIIDDILRLYNLTEDDLLSDTNGYYAKLHGLTDAPSGAIAPSEPRVAYGPLYGRVHAGSAQDPEILDDKIPMPYEVWERHKNGYFLEVEGTCMDKVYPEGCYVFVDPDTIPRNESIGVVSIDGLDYVMRRLRVGANTMLLCPESHDPSWEDIVVTGDREVRMIGTVVWFQASRELE